MCPSHPDEVFSIIASEKLDYPVIVRITGDHNAASMVLINGLEDLDKLHVFPFDTREFYLTEFVDCSDDSGIYFKHRIIMVDGQPVVRHVNFDKVWMVNSSCLDFVAAHPELGTLQRHYIDLNDNRLPLARDKFIEIGKRVGLEFFGIDCLIKPNGDVLIFEANANMNTLNSRPPELTWPLEILMLQMEKLIQNYSGESIS